MAEQLSTPPTNAKNGADEKGPNRLLIIGVTVLVVLIFLAILAGLIVLAIQHPLGTASIRDFAIIFVAVMSIFIGLALIYLLFQLAMLFLLLRDEIKPLLVSLNDTVSTLRGTTEFMSDNVVQPTIKVASALSGVRRTIEVLAGIRSSIQPKQQKE